MRIHLDCLDFVTGNMLLAKKGAISAHDSCSTHKQAMSSWNEYTLNSERHTSVAHRLDSARAQVIKSNRHYIKTIAEVILLCAKQELALRGHKESSKSLTRGNLLEIHISRDPKLSSRSTRWHYSGYNLQFYSRGTRLFTFGWWDKRFQQSGAVSHCMSICWY